MNSAASRIATQAEAIGTAWTVTSIPESAAAGHADRDRLVQYCPNGTCMYIPPMTASPHMYVHGMHKHSSMQSAIVNCEAYSLIMIFLLQV